jgi:hypothetical protein
MSSRTFGPKLVERGFKKVKDDTIWYHGLALALQAGSGGWREVQ